MTVWEIALFILLSFRCPLAQAGAAQNEQQHDVVSKVSLKLHSTDTIFLFPSWYIFLNSNLILGEHTQSHSYYVDIMSWNTRNSQKLQIPKPKVKYGVKQNWICASDLRFLSLYVLCLETKQAGPGLSIKATVIWPRAVMDPWGLLSCFTLVTCVLEDTLQREALEAIKRQCFEAEQQVESYECVPEGEKKLNVVAVQE